MSITNIPSTKICSCCKEDRPKEDFYLHRKRKDGLQTTCKLCIKTVYGKWLSCSKCNSQFFIKHRNVRKRKEYLCKECIKENLIKRNKARSSEFILTEKGYEYVRDLNESHGYKLNHRKVMSEYLKRELLEEEVVHHIDGNKRNNSIENLFLTNCKGHAKAHRSLVLIAYRLILEKQISFNKEEGIYQLNFIKEVN